MELRDDGVVELLVLPHKLAQPLRVQRTDLRACRPPARAAEHALAGASGASHGQALPGGPRTNRADAPRHRARRVRGGGRAREAGAELRQTYGLAQVAVRGGVRQVEHGGLIVGEDPREDRVLRFSTHRRMRRRIESPTGHPAGRLGGAVSLRLPIEARLRQARHGSLPRCCAEDPHRPLYPTRPTAPPSQSERPRAAIRPSTCVRSLYVLPAMVLRRMRYSKFEICHVCHRCVKRSRCSSCGGSSFDAHVWICQEPSPPRQRAASMRVVTACRARRA